MPFTPQYGCVGPYDAGRLDPAEYLHYPEKVGRGWYQPPIKGWYQCGALRKNVKPYYHLVWPKDKDRGKFGRLKDILQGKGPDIHLSISAQKSDYVWNRPLKGTWSNWSRLDPRLTSGPPWPGQKRFKEPCWVGDQSKKYNFYTRKYEHYRPDMWTDAIWQGPHKGSKWPHQYRDVQGVWYEDTGWNPCALGQKMNQI